MKSQGFTLKDVDELCINASLFLKESGALMNTAIAKYDGYNPANNSIAANDYLEYKNKDAVDTVYYSTYIKLETATEHLVLLLKGYENPVVSIPTWANVRAILELCGLISWVLDPSLTIQTRINRVYSIRYHDISEHLKLLNVEPSNRQAISLVEQRLQKVKNDAVSLGCPTITNKNGKIDGIGERYPNYINLVRDALGREREYRLSSGAIHGSDIALNQLGYEGGIVAPDQEGIVHLEKIVNPNFPMYQLQISISAISQCIWYRWRLLGWGDDEIIHFLDSSFDRMKFDDSYRVWRNTH
jgi:hypothetical protein